jgi:hypothetical protein
MHTHAAEREKTVPCLGLVGSVYPLLYVHAPEVILPGARSMSTSQEDLEKVEQDLTGFKWNISLRRYVVHPKMPHTGIHVG